MTEQAQEQEQAQAKDTQNGVTRPGPDSKTGIVWAICDRLYQEKGECPSRKEVVEVAKVEGVASATASTQHGRWKKYMGLTDPNAFRGRKKAAAATEGVAIA